ncbi:hypothetical protein EMCG_00551 [[Emmonsia] crescens]|uniref:Cytochrome b5 heme-binding domain-containing protein n=1 Tax=[Emmonsia] crescens TaxID=73230 RepID=A0A0G2HU41_9EURO|nr:hypothetical protein EMCG_00551 [Emmonsia crescens UAMH 3008]
MSNLRQRPGKASSSSPSKQRTGAREDELDYDYDSASSAGEEKISTVSEEEGNTETEAEAEQEQSRRVRAISILDIFRVIFLLFLTSAALSYYVTTDSVMWGYKPRFTRWAVLKSYIRGPITLTSAQLSLYNGTDPSLPIYVAINRTIFDVSSNPRIYGKGGGYNTLAGVDATRAYVTGCFTEDRTPDIRGVELMYIPIEDDEENPVEVGMSGAQKKIRREREMREARESVRKQVKHWRDFFANHKDYFEVGRVVGIDEMMEGGPERELCEAAQKQRPLRSTLNKEKLGLRDG